MKIIFLDIDGVLNNEYTKAFAPSGALFVSDRLLKNLSKIVKVTGAEIVLSSSWRLDWVKGKETKDFLALQSKLKDFSIELFDKTPLIKNGANRGAEIEEWLKYHPEVENYVILDDESNLFSSNEHLILTNSYYGLTESITDQVISLLNEKTV